MTGESTIPAFHATDSYRKHHQCLAKLYDEVWPQLALSADGRTPKGDALYASLHPYGGSNGFCTITGEPYHDSINLKKAASRGKNDYWDLIGDHRDLISRLSANQAPPRENVVAGPPEISKAARKLLRMAVQEHGRAFESAKQHGTELLPALREFLGHPAVRSSGTWKALFGATPPRGTLARVAKRLGAQLHDSRGHWLWESRDDFIKEVETIQEWYATGRKLSRRRMGIIRIRFQKPRIYRANCVMTSRVREHYRRLLDPLRLQGLFRWSFVAQGLRGAGIKMQTGTVPVERLWAGLLWMFPTEATQLGMDWFNFLAKISYFRFNYRHFHCSSSPAWTEQDSLVAERLEDICANLFPWGASG